MIWARELQRLGHEVVISTYWGIQGGATQWEGMTVLPGFGPAYCSNSLYQHSQHFNPDLVITLGDVWVMDASLLRELPVAHWLPGDCRPMSLADRNVVEASRAELMAMSKFGWERFKTAGQRALYVPHGIDTNVFKPLNNIPELRETCGVEDQFIIGLNQANNMLSVRRCLNRCLLSLSFLRIVMTCC
jgi:hypothetical protein